MSVENLVKTQSRDAREWAREFCMMTQFPDVELAHGWFANAMMAMHDSIFNNELKQLQAENDRLKADLKATERHLKQWDDDMGILQEKLKLAVGALRFYAKDAWEASGYLEMLRVRDADAYNYEGMIYVGGKLARETLAKIGEIK